MNKLNEHRAELSHGTWFGCNSQHMKKNDSTGLDEHKFCIQNKSFCYLYLLKVLVCFLLLCGIMEHKIG